MLKYKNKKFGKDFVSIGKSNYKLKIQIISNKKLNFNGSDFSLEI